MASMNEPIHRNAAWSCMVWMDQPSHLLVDGGSEGVGRVDDASGVLVGVVHVGDGVLRHALQVAATPRRVPTAGVW